VRTAALAVAFAVSALNASAQTPLTYQEMWNNRIENIKLLRDQAALDLANRVGAEVSINLNIKAFMLFAYAQNLTRELRFIEDARTDKQLGSPAVTPGSTSLVSRAGTPSILAFAIEHGALTQTSNATSATVRGNAIGWLDLLKDQNFIDSYDNDSGFVRALRRVSYSFTFDTDTANVPVQAVRPSPTALVQQLEDYGRQLASYSFRVTLVDQRDPRRRDNRAKAATFVDDKGAALLEAQAFLDSFLLSQDYRLWLNETQVALSAPGSMSRGEIERVLYRRLEIARAMMAAKVPDFEDGVARFVTALNAFESGRTALFTSMQKRFMMAVELVRERPPAVPATSTYRVVAEGRPGGGPWNIAANGAFAHQDTGTVNVPDPKDVGGWGDWQIAVQAERGLGKADPCASTGAGRPALAFEYLLQHLNGDGVVTFAGYQYSVDKGTIHAGQAKLTIPIKGSGVKVPLSISVANRTELLHETNVRGHIGITFDLDVLTAAVKK
jgi:hypothetical protein